MKGVRESGGTLIGAGFVLVFTVPMVRICGRDWTVWTSHSSAAAG